jgi:hypothetical protein
VAPALPLKITNGSEHYTQGFNAHR